MSLLLLLLLLVLLLQLLLLLLLRHNSGDYNKYMVSEVQYVDIVSHISMKSGGDNTDLEGVEVISHLSMKEGGSDAHMHDVEVVSHISMQSKLSEHHRRILGKRSVAEAIADVEQHIAQHASRTIIDNSQLEHDDGKPCEEQLDEAKLVYCKGDERQLVKANKTAKWDETATPEAPVQVGVSFACKKDIRATGPMTEWVCHICGQKFVGKHVAKAMHCLLYTSPSPRDGLLSRMPSSA